jgi:hypothetical protein
MSTPEPTTDPPPDPRTPDVKTFTQDQVNALLADQKRKVQGQYSDHGDLKKKAADYDALVASQRTEQEKAAETARQEREQAVEAARKEGAGAVLAAANQRLVSSEARALAAEAGFRSPTLIVKALDLSEVTVSEDGTVDAAAITAALKTLAAAEPYLVNDDAPRIPRPDPSQGSGRGPAPTGAEKGVAEAERRYGKPASS